MATVLKSMNKAMENQKIEANTLEIDTKENPNPIMDMEAGPKVIQCQEDMEVEMASQEKDLDMKESSGYGNGHAMDGNESGIDGQVNDQALDKDDVEEIRGKSPGSDLDGMMATTNAGVIGDEPMLPEKDPKDAEEELTGSEPAGEVHD